MLLTKEKIQNASGREVWMTTEEIQLLQKYAQLAKTQIVEIGCAFGGSTIALISAAPVDCQVLSIDPFVPDSMGHWAASAAACKFAVTTATQTLHNREPKNWLLISDFSFNVVQDWNDLIDLLFIDGDHHYEAVKKDFEQWSPYVKTGGIILIHDSRRPDNIPPHEFVTGWPGPTKLVKELEFHTEFEIIDYVDSLTVFKKL